ncbi:CRACD-like protein [Megalops cyprinoides]|uniref:CRACD-like protein n=1 Tax=Megalops cyprinoides TaxID=118141 RepID=UPI001863B2CC|nr:CRACD-like protein [Megalops cyprinoides]
MAGFYNCLRGKTDYSVMASGLSDVTANQEPTDTTEECPGKKKSKFQTFKKLFTKKKRKESPLSSGESALKSSQSSDDLNAPKPAPVQSAPSEDSGSKVNMGNKAMSHDSVFVSDSPSSETNDGMVSSQESIHGKVKSLQLQLKEAIRVGSPPALICPKRGEDTGALSEDDGLPHSPPEMSTLHTVLTGSSQRSSNPAERTSLLSLEGSDSDDDEMSCEASSRPASPFITLPADFSQPASPAGCLDSSAARHRIALKHKACAKRKPASRDISDSSKLKVFGGTQRTAEDDLTVVNTEPSSEEWEDKDVMMEQTDADRDRTEAQPISSVSSLVEPAVTVCLLTRDHEEQEEQSTAQDPSDKGSQLRDASSSSENESDAEEIPSASHPVPEPQQFLQTAALASLVPPAGHCTDPVLLGGCEADNGGPGSLLEEVLNSLEGPCAATHVIEPDDTALELRTECNASENLAEDQGSSCPASDCPQARGPSAPGPKGPSPPYLGDPCTDATSNKEQCEELGKCDKQDDSTSPVEYCTEDNYLPEEVEEKEDEEHETEEKLGEGLEDTGEEFEEAGEELEGTREEIKEEGEENKEEVEELEEKEVEFEEEGENVEAEVTAAACEQPSSVELKEEEASSDSTGTAGVQSDDDSDSERGSITSLERTFEHSTPVENVGDCDRPSQPANKSTLTPEQNQLTALDPSVEEPGDTTDNVSEPSTGNHSNISQTAEDHGKQPASTGSKVRFTIAPAWQRSLSGGASREPHFAPPVDPEAFEEWSDGARDPVRQMKDRMVEPLPPVKADPRSSPNRTPFASPLLREPSPQEAGSAENPFGIRLRRTSALLRYCDTGVLELTGNTALALPTEPQNPPLSQPPNTKPTPPKKPDPLDDTTAKVKKTPELAVGRAPEGGVAAPSWISVARQKQKVFKENSLDETAQRKSTSEQNEPQRKISLPVPISQTNKEQPMPSNSPTAAPWSQEISANATAEREGKRVLSHLPPSPLGQDEPPWMALAKKKAKAWSEMPQIVQ